MESSSELRSSDPSADSSLEVIDIAASQLSNRVNAEALRLYRPSLSTHKSDVWKHFKLSKLESEESYAFCVAGSCAEKLIHSHSTTSNLSAHLRRHHPEVSISNKTSSVVQLKVGFSRQHRTAINLSLAKLYVANCWSFNSVEAPEWIDFANALSEGRYKPPGRTSLTEICDRLYESMVETLMSEVENQCISITTDSATLLNGRPYIAITGHYITEQWVMRDVVLSVMLSEESHTGEHVSDLLDRVMEEWTLKDRAFAVVTDNGANFVKAARVNSHFKEQHRCAVHTYQLALKDAAAEISFFAVLIDKARSLVTVVRRSQPLKQRLAELQAEVKRELADIGSAADDAVALVLVKDVSTRFNSICFVFSRLLRVKESLSRLCRADAELTSYAFSDDEWKRMDGCNEVLKLVRSACDILERSSTPTLSLVYPLFHDLRESLQGKLPSRLNLSQLAPETKDLCNFLITRIDERLGTDPPPISIILSYALDPRVRTKTMAPAHTRAYAQMELSKAFETFDWKRYTGQRLLVPSPAVTPQSEEEVVRSPKRQRLEEAWAEEVGDEKEASEVERFLNIKKGIPLDECPLAWWKERCADFPTIAAMARVYLPVPASSASAERVFSVGPMVLQHRRRQLHPDRVASLMWMKRNMKLYEELQRGKSK